VAKKVKPTGTVLDQVQTDRYALFNGDSCEVLPGLPDGATCKSRARMRTITLTAL